MVVEGISGLGCSACQLVTEADVWSRSSLVWLDCIGLGSMGAWMDWF